MKTEFDKKVSWVLLLCRLTAIVHFEESDDAFKRAVSKLPSFLFCTCYLVCLSRFATFLNVVDYGTQILESADFVCLVASATSLICRIIYFVIMRKTMQRLLFKVMRVCWNLILPHHFKIKKLLSCASRTRPPRVPYPKHDTARSEFI